MLETPTGQPMLYGIAGEDSGEYHPAGQGDPAEMETDELLAAALAGDGEDDPLAAAREILSGAGGLYGLRRMDAGRLKELPATVAAVVELSRRMMGARGPELPKIGSPADVHTLLAPTLQDLDREHLVALLLDTRNQVLGSPTISVGTLSSSLVHPREVFKPAIAASAANVIVAHNHPTGSTRPTTEDRQITRRLVEAGKNIGIEVLDHVIIGREGDGYLSLKERGEL